MGSGVDRQSAEVYRLEPAESHLLRSRVDLAHSPAFSLGGLRVEPGTRQVIGTGGLSETLEPRVMEVFVALQRADGAILSRDDLIAACWRGMAVGEDAIQRAIQRLRKLAAASGAFRIETITRVGYRLLPADAAADAGAQTGKKRLKPGLIIASMLVAIAALFAVWFAQGPLTGLPSPGHHLALQPVENIGGGETEVARALTESLRSRLVDFEVSLADGQDDLSLRAALRREQDGYRVTATLDNRGAGRTIWSGAETFSADSLGIDEAAHWLARSIGCAFSMLRDDPEATESPLMPIAMKDCAARKTDFARRLQLAREMVAADPGSPLGHFAVASAASALMKLQEGNRRELQREGLAALERYRRIRPDTADGLAGMAMLGIDLSPQERERILRSAIDARFVRCKCPLQFLGDFLLQSGRVDEAGDLYRRALDHGPQDPLGYLRAATAAEAAGMRGSADEYFARAAAMPGAGAFGSRMEIARGLWRLDREALRRGLSAFPAGGDAGTSASRAAIQALIDGSEADRLRAARALVAVPSGLRSDGLTVELLAALGAHDQAFGVIESSRRRGGDLSAPGKMAGSSAPYLWSPALRDLRRDPRFVTHLRRAGFYQYWRATGSRPTECRTDDPPEYCAGLT